MLHVVHFALLRSLEQGLVRRLVSPSQSTVQLVLCKTVSVDDLGHMVLS